MTPQPTVLRRYGIFTRFTYGMCLAFFAILAGILCWPLWLAVPFVPFIWLLSYIAEGVCPWCGEAMMVYKKKGGAKCRACKKSVQIFNKQLHPI